MVRIKHNKLLRHFFLIFIYLIISFFILFNFIEYLYAEKKEDATKVNISSSQIEFNDEHSNSEEELNNFIFKIINLFKRLLNVKEDKIVDNPGINTNSMKTLLDIQKIIEDYDIIEVIDVDEIIDMNYEKDINYDREIISVRRYPEFLSNFWNKFKEAVTSYG